ncbi:MAG: RiPP maturation radical SAM protein 1, partial [Alphaproteobacteria bacterium]|nr:RiPP maturation radical SAM protein 1 [Alphaproteobacteria bacterium]
MSDVVLVFMPYATVDRPSLGLGLLGAKLRQIDIDVTLLHANVIFASRIGLKSYNRLNTSSNLDLLGEWTFSKAAFGDYESGPEGFLGSLRKPADTDDVLRVREMTPAFVEEMADLVLAAKPRIVGCSSMFQQNCASLALLKRIRERDPSIVTAMGGANCETEVGRALHTHFPWVDYVFSGECDDL